MEPLAISAFAGCQSIADNSVYGAAVTFFCKQKIVSPRQCTQTSRLHRSSAASTAASRWSSSSRRRSIELPTRPSSLLCSDLCVRLNVLQRIITALLIAIDGFKITRMLDTALGAILEEAQRQQAVFRSACVRPLSRSQNNLDAVVFLVAARLVEFRSLIQPCAMGNDKTRINLAFFDTATRSSSPLFVSPAACSQINHRDERAQSGFG